MDHHYFTSEDCPIDGSRFKGHEQVQQAVERLAREGHSLTVDAMRMYGVPEETLEGTIVIDFGGKAVLQSFIPQARLASGRLVIVLVPAL